MTESTADLTQGDIELALGYLAETAKGVTEAVRELNAEQWRYKAAPDRWSTAEILEHLALLEELFTGTMAHRLRAAPADAGGRDFAAGDARIRTLVPDRSVSTTTAGRVSLAVAPQPIVPTGAWTPEESMDRFRNARERTAEFLQAARTGLRGRMMEHPALGPLDGFQWILFLAAHAVRHTRQILELQTDPGFPPFGSSYFAGPSETTEFLVEG